MRLEYRTDDIKRAIPIADVLSHYAGINVSSNNRQIRCPNPTHDDKKPSATVYQKTNTCRCWSQCNCTMDVFDIASMYTGIDSKTQFPELCERICQDFGLDRYSYSNLAEVERANQYARENRFLDVFPITPADMECIGLHNPDGKERYTVTVDQWMREYHDEPVEGEKGQETFTVDRFEALKMGITQPYIDEVERGVECKYPETAYKRPPSLQELWKEDKELVEEMILNKCMERLEAYNEKLFEMKALCDVYRKENTVEDIQKASRLREGLIKYLAQGYDKDKILNPEQKKMVAFLDHYEHAKETIAILDELIQETQEVANKVKHHQAEREKAERKERFRSGFKKAKNNTDDFGNR